MFLSQLFVIFISSHSLFLFAELKRNSMSAAFSITDIMAAGDEIDEEDTGGPSKAKGKKKKKGKKLEEEIEGLFLFLSFLKVSSFFFEKNSFGFFFSYNFLQMITKQSLG